VIVSHPRLDDPNDHFPYRRDDALRAGLSVEIVDATDDYIKAQAKVLEDQSDKNVQAYRKAKERLVQARRKLREESAQADNGVDELPPGDEDLVSADELAERTDENPES
jgi:enoyl-CoA hydratase/carnithine racemase